MSIRGIGSLMVNEDDFDIDPNEISRGGFGLVRKGVRKDDGLPVAVKYMFQNKFDTTSFIRELTISVQIVHPAVLSSIGFTASKIHANQHVLVTPFMDK